MEIDSNDVSKIHTFYFFVRSTSSRMRGIAYSHTYSHTCVPKHWPRHGLYKKKTLLKNRV